MTKNQIKAVVTGVVFAASLGVTLWKGPGAASAVSHAVMAICFLFATLGIIPPDVEADIETALKGVPTPSTGEDTTHYMAKLRLAKHLGKEIGS